MCHGTQDPDVLRDMAHPLGRNQGQENAVCVTGAVTHALTSEGFDASEDGTGRGSPLVAFQERGRDGGRSVEVQVDLAYALTSPKGGGRAQERNICTTFGVRRLTPTECERLQGQRDGHTAIVTGKWRKIDADEADYLRAKGLPAEMRKGAWHTCIAADGPRYRQLGNSKAVPVVQWLGRRIQAALGGQP